MVEELDPPQVKCRTGPLKSVAPPPLKIPRIILQPSSSPSPPSTRSSPHFLPEDCSVDLISSSPTWSSGSSSSSSSSSSSRSSSCGSIYVMKHHGALTVDRIEHCGSHHGESSESSPSWASSSASNTPNFSSDGLAFEFNQKCSTTASADNLLSPSSGGGYHQRPIVNSHSTDRLSTTECNSNATPSSPCSPCSPDSRCGGGFPFYHRSSSERMQQKRGSGEMERNRIKSGGRFSKLLRRTHSAGCSKDVPAHALFLQDKRVSVLFFFVPFFMLTLGG